MDEPQQSDTNSSLDAKQLAEIQRLTAGYCDESLSAGQIQELDQLLAEFPQARREHLQLMQMHVDLVAHGKKKSAGAYASPIQKIIELAESQQSITLSRSIASPSTWIWAAAACLLVALPFFISRWANSESTTVATNPISRKGSSSQAKESQLANSMNVAPEIIGEIISTSKESRLFVGGVQIDSLSGAPLFPGQEICLVGGTAEIRFVNGVRSALKAPLILTPESSMLVRLTEGSLASDVGKAGNGFTVTTEQARVIDLGTSFGISANLDGTTQVVVFDGEVDVLSQEDYLADVEVSPLRLKMGEGVNVRSDGHVSPAVSFVSSDYLRPRPMDVDDRIIKENSIQDSVITSVSDSLSRWPSNYFQYEIIVGGLQEDAVAFADRIHQWNGIDKKGIPKYLLGGDYVKMINNARNIDDYRVFITTNQPTILYVLADDRVPPPQWLTDQFEDTGDDIGMDEGPHLFSWGGMLERDLPSAGPGISIDHVHSIWRKEVANPDTVELGVWAYPEIDYVMYGIVAVPKI